MKLKDTKYYCLKNFFLLINSDSYTIMKLIRILLINRNSLVDQAGAVFDVSSDKCSLDNLYFMGNMLRQVLLGSLLGIFIL